MWVAAIIGKQHIQLWSFYNDGKAICSRLEALSLDTGSAGFQLLARWLATPFSVRSFAHALERHKHHQAMLWATQLGNAGFILIMAGACLACRTWDTSLLPFLALLSWRTRPWL